MFDNPPKVSVVIPAYNASPTIKSTIDSVLLQTYRNIELIIVDDGSTDETAEIVKSFHDTRLKYIFQQHSERAVARNNGIAKSTGDMVAFVDADDTWLPEKLTKQVKILINDTSLGLVYCDLYQIRPNSGQTLLRFGERQKFYRGKIDITKLLKVNFIQSPTPLIRKNVLDSIGGFDNDLVPIEDWDLWIRIASQYPIDYVDEPMAIYSLHTQATGWINNPDQLLIKTKDLLAKYNRVSIHDPKIEKGKRQSLGIAYYQYGRSMEHWGLYSKALTAFKKSLSCYPSHLKTYIRFLQVYKRIIFP